VLMSFLNQCALSLNVIMMVMVFRLNEKVCLLGLLFANRATLCCYCAGFLLGAASDLGLVKGFLCVFWFYLPRACLFILCFWCIFSRLFCVVSTSASDCLERLVSEITYYVSSGYFVFLLYFLPFVLRCQYQCK